LVLNVASAAGAIPNIFGGFAPFPNTIGTALMAYQSEAIGYGFGIKYQYAKRSIGAKSNENFNALSLTDIGNMIEQHNNELLNRMKNEMPKWVAIQQDFIEASVQIELAKANRTPSAWAEITNGFIQGLAGQNLNIPEGTYDGTNEGLVALTSVSPLLGMLAALGQLGTGDGGTEPPPPSGGAGSFEYMQWHYEYIVNAYYAKETTPRTVNYGSTTELDSIIETYYNALNSIIQNYDSKYITENEVGWSTSADAQQHATYLQRLDQYNSAQEHRISTQGSAWTP
jgi:hypothetical protein